MSTMKIKPSHPSQGDFVIIEGADFNPEIHEEYSDVPKQETEQDSEASEAQVTPKRGRPAKEQ